MLWFALVIVLNSFFIVAAVAIVRWVEMPPILWCVLCMFLYHTIPWQYQQCCLTDSCYSLARGWVDMLYVTIS